MPGPRPRGLLAVAAAAWSAPEPALAHSGPCSGTDVLTTLGIGSALGLLLFRPWRRTPMSRSARLRRWTLPLAATAALALGACGGKSGTPTVRPETAARIEIVSPRPDQTLGPNFTVDVNLIGATIVPENVTGGPLRPDEGHIHVLLDGKLIAQTFGTREELRDVAPGPHVLQAEFVAADHAPFRNRVIAAVAFSVAPGGPGG